SVVDSSLWMRSREPPGLLLLVNHFLSGSQERASFGLSLGPPTIRACPMRCPSFFAALALVLGSTQTMACQNEGCAIGDKLAAAECNSIGCVRPTNAFQKLAKIAERPLSVMQVTEPPNALGLCGAGNCATDPTVSPLTENCGSAGCATPEPKPRPSA